MPTIAQLQKKASAKAPRKRKYNLAGYRKRAAQSTSVSSAEKIQWQGEVLNVAGSVVKARFFDTNGGYDQMMEFPLKQLQPTTAKFKVRQGSLLSCTFYFDEHSADGIVPGTLKIRLIQATSVSPVVRNLTRNSVAAR